MVLVSSQLVNFYDKRIATSCRSSCNYGTIIYGITIECISARLLKARISTKPNFVTFVVAYAPTEETPEGQTAKYMAALNCTVASVPAVQLTPSRVIVSWS